jgi:hypothetical protein
MAPRPADDLRLLADARLMSGYAARMGRLQNGTILDSIDKLAAAPTSGPAHDKAFSELSWGLNVLSQALAPVTLMDLGSDWQPYPQHRLDAKVRPFIALAAALLIAVLGYFTFRASSSPKSPSISTTTICKSCQDCRPSPRNSASPPPASTRRSTS